MWWGCWCGVVVAWKDVLLVRCWHGKAVAMPAVPQAGQTDFHPSHPPPLSKWHVALPSCLSSGTMALAAIYGGPVFNVLVAWSGPTLYAALRHGPMTYQLSPGVGILVAFTLGVLCLQLAAIPLLSWRLDRRAAAAVLALFVLAQAFFLSKELF